MLQPIQKDHELVCPGCGCVLQNTIESNNIPENEIIPTMSLNIHLLGSALEKNVKYAYPRTSQQSREEQVLRQLEHITKKYDLPSRFALETFNQLKRKNRGFWSETEPIKQLIKILSKDENYFHIKKLQKIKARYENKI